MSNAPKTSDSSSSNNLEKKPDKSELEQIIINDPSVSSVEAVPERPLAFECQRCDKKFASVKALSGHQNAHKSMPPALQRCGWKRAMLVGVFDPRFYGASAMGPAVPEVAMQRVAYTGKRAMLSDGFDPRFYGASASGLAVPEGPMQPVAYIGKPICMSPLLQTMTHGPFYSHLVSPRVCEPNLADFERFSVVPVVNPIQACESKGVRFEVPEMVRVTGPETRAPGGSRASQSVESGLDLSLKLSCELFNGGTTKRFDFEERDDSGLDLSLKL